MATRLMSPERRSSPRVKTGQAPLVLGEDGSVMNAQMHDLSTTGVYCTSERFIAPMSKLEVRFELPVQGKPLDIQCRGVVVRIEPVVTSPERGSYQIAIFFTELLARDRLAIAQFVRERLPEHHP